jgi:hypothetical protein
MVWRLIYFERLGGRKFYGISMILAVSVSGCISLVMSALGWTAMPFAVVAAVSVVQLLHVKLARLAATAGASFPVDKDKDLLAPSGVMAPVGGGRRGWWFWVSTLLLSSSLLLAIFLNRTFPIR